MSTLGDIATVAAPTVVALAAIGASTWQQSRSRAFDRAEREKERAHDREMREAAERHERKLSDVEYQRKLVDDAIEAMEAANEAVPALAVEWDLRLSDEDPPGDYEKERWEELITAASDASDRLNVIRTRMVLRFGPKHEVIETLDRAARAASSAWWIAIQNEHGREDDGRDVSRRLNAASTTTSKAMKAFLNVAGSTVGSG